MERGFAASVVSSRASRTDYTSSIPHSISRSLAASVGVGGRDWTSVRGFISQLPAVTALSHCERLVAPTLVLSKVGMEV